MSQLESTLWVLIMPIHLISSEPDDDETGQIKPEFVLTLGTGITCDDPSIGQIAAYLRELPFYRQDRNYLILDKVGIEGDETTVAFMQARPYDNPYQGTFVVEYRDGAAGRQYCAGVDEGAALENIFASYLAQDGAWKEMAVWRDMSYRFADLRARMPESELTESYFTQQEWEEAAEKRKDSSFEFWHKLYGEEAEEI
jgi:hypothetical protein